MHPCMLISLCCAVWRHFGSSATHRLPAHPVKDCSDCADVHAVLRLRWVHIRPCSKYCSPVHLIFPCSAIFSIHYDCLVGTRKKLRTLRFSGLWCFKCVWTVSYLCYRHAFLPEAFSRSLLHVCEQQRLAWTFAGRLCDKYIWSVQNWARSTELIRVYRTDQGLTDDHSVNKTGQACRSCSGSTKQSGSTELTRVYRLDQDLIGD